MRQDVGVKLKASFQSVGDDIVIDVHTEMSSVQAPSSIGKVMTSSSAVTTGKKSVLVTTLDTEDKRYELTVTPTKLR